MAFRGVLGLAHAHIFSRRVMPQVKSSPLPLVFVSRCFMTSPIFQNSFDEMVPSRIMNSVKTGSVVKVYAEISAPSYTLPWQLKHQRQSNGSGFVVKGKRILTNAHIVADQTYTRVRKHGTPDLYSARVVAVSHDSDLALLSVDDDSFWDGVQELQFGDIPEIQDEVKVVGYPTGGDNISITAGVVSRIEVLQYFHSALSLMAIQIDAAINPGNSGGPAFKGEDVIGVAFQKYQGNDNIGYLIPVPLIRRFFEAVDDCEANAVTQGQQESSPHIIKFCCKGFSYQHLANQHMRAHLSMKKGQSGVLVYEVPPLSPANGPIKKGDVLLEFDGKVLANDGTVVLRREERIPFEYLVSLKRIGESSTVKLLRDGKEISTEITFDSSNWLVPVENHDRLPTFFIFSGLVFLRFVQPYLHEYGSTWYDTSPRWLLQKAIEGIVTKPGEEVVILSQVLADEVNSGFEDLTNLQVKKCNGADVLNIAQLWKMFQDNEEDYIRLDFEDQRSMIIDYKVGKQAHERIMHRYRVPGECSDDLQEPER